MAIPSNEAVKIASPVSGTDSETTPLLNDTEQTLGFEDVISTPGGSGKSGNA